MKSDLSVRQRRAIPLLVASRTIVEGCKKAGITEKTYYEWVKTSVFQDALHKAQSNIIDDALGKLRGNINKAIDALVELLDTDNDSLKRLVANDIIAHTLKMRELEDIEGRLETIERIVLERRTYR